MGGGGEGGEGDGGGASSVRRKRGHSKWMMFYSAGKTGAFILPGGGGNLERAKIGIKTPVVASGFVFGDHTTLTQVMLSSCFL